ncbi:MAG: DUF885 family protein [Verrucomicrobia bacterium]|nr:DUF885 family protein [Verrucomicrobiota bacterium]
MLPASPARLRPSFVVLALLPSLLEAASTPAADFRAGQPVPAARAAEAYVPDLSTLLVPGAGDLRLVVERYVADRDALRRYHAGADSPLQLARLRAFHGAWLTRLEAVAFDALAAGARLDWLLLRNHLRHELALLERSDARQRELLPLLPFAEKIAALQEDRRAFVPVVPPVAAGILADVVRDTKRLRAAAETPGAQLPPPGLALRAAHRIGELLASLKNWFEYYDAYDPQFAWWMREPYRAASRALTDYARFLREKAAGVKDGDDEPIVGEPIGVAGLRVDLEREMVPYSPEELIAAGERELAWCEAEWKRAARDLGLGDDWRAALERIKQDHVAPGEQPALIAQLAYEAIDFVTSRDLLTVPPHAIDTFRMSMLSPERQKVAPFFLGGENIQVAFPTDTMEHAAKLDSLRANNRHFCRATVHHELIPGHHLQQWYEARHHPHRQLFTTPFWIEGWALWWEFRLWDLGFAQSPENRAGMLFWRTHRCARILFSLNFHLGRWTPQQCIDFLVERVGHDRHTATGEVRRSLNGSYSPLYQAAYMLGAIQLRALYTELVTSGRMPEKVFHDRILMGGPMPIELVRANLTGTLLPRDFRSTWKFLAPAQ